MEPIPFKEANLNLVDGNKVGKILDLPAARVECEGQPCIVTKWRLTIPEIEEITKTGVLWMTLMGDAHPPVSLSARSPFGPG